MDWARNIQSNTAKNEEQNWTPTQRWQALLTAFVQILRQKQIKRNITSEVAVQMGKE